MSHDQFAMKVVIWQNTLNFFLAHSTLIFKFHIYSLNIYKPYIHVYITRTRTMQYVNLKIVRSVCIVFQILINYLSLSLPL